MSLMQITSPHTWLQPQLPKRCHVLVSRALIRRKKNTVWIIDVPTVPGYHSTYVATTEPVDSSWPTSSKTQKQRECRWCCRLVGPLSEVRASADLLGVFFYLNHRLLSRELKSHLPVLHEYYWLILGSNTIGANNALIFVRIKKKKKKQSQDTQLFWFCGSEDHIQMVHF